MLYSFQWNQYYFYIPKLPSIVKYTLRTTMNHSICGCQKYSLMGIYMPLLLFLVFFLTYFPFKPI